MVEVMVVVTEGELICRPFIYVLFKFSVEDLIYNQYLHTYILTYSHTRLHINIHTYTLTHPYPHTSTNSYPRVHMKISRCTHTHWHVHLHTHTHTYTYIHTYLDFLLPLRTTAEDSPLKRTVKRRSRVIESDSDSEEEEKGRWVSLKKLIYFIIFIYLFICIAFLYL